MGAALPESAYKSIADSDFFAALDLQRPGLEGVSHRAQDKEYLSAWREWGAYFARRRRPAWVVEPARYAEFLDENFPAYRPAIIAEADRIVGHNLRQGNVLIPYQGGHYDWLDPQPPGDTNYYGAFYFFWMTCLGRAYALTADEKYVRAFVESFGDWYDQRPQIEAQDRRGLVWHNLPLGLGARILADVYHFVRTSPELSPEMHARVLKQLLGSARWLDAHNQSYGRGNQPFTAACTLVILGTMFPELRESQRWLATGMRQMIAHLREDVYPDGTHKELCTQYHKTCLRDASVASIVLERNRGWGLYTGAQKGSLPEGLRPEDINEARRQFERMYDWLARIMMPSGHTPALHSAVYADDWINHLALAGVYYRRPDFAWLVLQHLPEHRVPYQKGRFAIGNYLLNEEARLGALRALGPRPPEYLCTLLKDGGFAVLRDGWQADALYMILQWGQANTGHAYPANLSFVLAGRGVPLALQPGSTISYSVPDYAQWCHTTPSHNTVVVNEKSYPNVKGIPPGGELDLWADLPGVTFLRAHHDGYRASDGVTHSRTVVFLKGEYFVVADRLAGGEAGTTYDWYLHPRREMRETGPGAYQMSEGPGLALRLGRPEEVTETLTGRGLSAVPTHGGENIWERIPYLAFRKIAGREPSVFFAVLYPFTGGPAEMTVRSLEVASDEPGTFAGYEIERPGGVREVVLLSAGGDTVYRAAGYRCDGVVSVIRRRGALMLGAAATRFSHLEHRGRVLMEGEHLEACEVQWEMSKVKCYVDARGPTKLRVWSPGCAAASCDAGALPCRCDGHIALVEVPAGRTEFVVR